MPGAGRFLCVGILFAMFCVPVSSFASITDLGDKFYDSATGWTWQDVYSYRGMSFDEVKSALPVGYHLAVVSDLNALWSSASGLSFDSADGIMGGSGFGVYDGNPMISGWYDDSLDGIHPGFNGQGVGRHDESFTTWYSLADNAPEDWANGNIGAWVVNSPVTAAPEPISATLFLLGSGALAAKRLKRKK